MIVITCPELGYRILGQIEQKLRSLGYGVKRNRISVFAIKPRQGPSEGGKFSPEKPKSSSPFSIEALPVVGKWKNRDCSILGNKKAFCICSSSPLGKKESSISNRAGSPIKITRRHFIGLVFAEMFAFSKIESLIFSSASVQERQEYEI